MLAGRSRTKEKNRNTSKGRLLGAVPVLAAVFLGALMLPRATAPNAIPFPEVDTRALETVVAADHARAVRARQAPLNGDVRALGSAVREFNTRQAKDEDARSLADARAEIELTIPRALAAGLDDVLALRAFQMETFLEEVRKFEATGIESEELKAVGGPFVLRMRRAGWCLGNKILLDDAERRAAYKLAWNAVTGVEPRAEFSSTFDETRALYTLYLRLPHMSESTKDAFTAARRGAKDKKACEALDAGEQLAIETWRYDKIKKLGAMDPSYPLAYSLGVSHYLRAQYPAAAESFRDWLRAHPTGPLTLRARNHLKASLDAAAF